MGNETQAKTKKQITEKQREACKKRGAEMGKKNGAQIREAKAITEERKVREFAKPLYTNPFLMANRIAAYMYSQDRAVTETATARRVGKPYTISGAQAALGIVEAGEWYDYLNGTRDHIIDEQLAGYPVMARSGMQTLTAGEIPTHLLQYVLYLMDIHLDHLTPDENGSISPSQEDIEQIQEQGSRVYFGHILKKYTLLVQSQRESDLYDKGRTSDIFIHKARYGWQDEQRITFTRNIITRDEARELLEMTARLPEIE